MIITSSNINRPLDYEIPQRQLDDRRQFSVKTITTSLMNPRRRYCRRQEDKKYPILDVYGWPHMLCAVALMLFSISDAIFTLLLLQQGGKELNPVMDYFLQMGIFEFISAKMLITFLCVFFFVASWNFLIFRYFRVRNFLFASLLIYTVLIIYELTLLAKAYPAAWNMVTVLS